MNRRLIGLVLSSGLLAWFAACATAMDVHGPVNYPAYRSGHGGEEFFRRSDPSTTGPRLTYGLPDSGCFNNVRSTLDLVYNGTDPMPTPASTSFSLPVSSLTVTGIPASALVEPADSEAGTGFHKSGNGGGTPFETSNPIPVLGSLGFIIAVIIAVRLGVRTD